MEYPKIIQGGMGVAVSSWGLARAVSSFGQMGVVSSTGIDAVFVRRLQLGDIGGHFREALDSFPLREMAERVWERYFVPGGKDPDAPFKSKPMPDLKLSRAFSELVIVANFAEVFLAKRGHNGLVGINLMEKIQLPTLPSLFGAMLAGVDFVLMGAGIPRAIPGVIDDLAAMRPSELRLDVTGALPGESFSVQMDPKVYAPEILELKRPNFLPIISSAALALTLSRKASGRVDGFVVEGWTAGGHNAPPRGALQLNDSGEPIYGERDIPDLEAIKGVGLPFWLAGQFGDPEKLVEALSTGAAGVQLGTPFAFCEESGILPELKNRVLSLAAQDRARVYTDPIASPTGFPFKVVQAPNTLSEGSVYKERTRICDIGYLRHAYRREDGQVALRCSAEPIEDYVAKGGDAAEAEGRKCLCNGLMATVGVGQIRKTGEAEPPIMTAGDDVARVGRFLKPGKASYSAVDVINYVLSGVTAGVGR